ncbi:type II secretion system protein [Bdellovibrio sp. HCB290]|uniref:type II secretion system protein n=1 Tax=Bdellovibrio sp. HCB290 TaxID=3394356 RepID=UPI0039B4BAB6
MMKNHGGFTFIEVAVSLAIISIIVMAMGMIFQTSFRGANLVEMRNTAANLNMSWQEILNTPAVCEMNFKGMTFDSSGKSAKNKFVDIANTILISDGVKSSGSDILVTDVRAQVREADWVAFDSAKASLGANTYIVNIDVIVSLERQKELISSKTSSLVVSVPVYMNSAGVVDSCLATQQDSIANAQELACTQLGGVFVKETSRCEFKQNCASLPADSAVSKECFDQLTGGLSQQITEIGKSTASMPPVSQIHKTIKDCLTSSQGANIAANKTKCRLGSIDFTASPQEFSYTYGATNYTMSDPVLAKYLFDLVVKYQTDGLMKITVGDK